jgi:cellulose biosynthesis protein BcsQ
MPFAAFFAQTGPTPTWTDKEVLLAVGGTIGALIPVVLFVLKLARSHAIGRARRAEAELARHRRPSVTTPPEPGPTEREFDLLQASLDDARQQLEALRETDATNTDQAAALRQNVSSLTTALDQMQGQLAEHRAELSERDRRIRRATQRDGQIWNERVLASTPDFRLLDPDGRRTPILSVLNLKGGVGKTTVTANLAAALAARGYRVLLLDLDLQGSLTGLFLTDAEQEALAGEERMLEDFLNRAFDAEFPNVLHYARPILGGRGALVPTADTLAYAETNLMIRWLLREANRDPRFLLRRELHLRRVTNEFDVVLLDCPPLVNVSCVNALAASDYLLVPVTPSRQATARVPVLLRRVRTFRENINPHLSVLGILANRTYGETLTNAESNRLTLLTAQCRDVWGDAVRQMDVIVRQTATVLRAEDEGRPLADSDVGADCFRRLAEEVEGYMPTFCRPRQPAGRPVREGIA